MFSDLSGILDKDYYEQQKDAIENKIKNGLIPVQTRVFEIIRFLTLKYCSLGNEESGMSSILKEMEFKLAEINMMIKTIIRRWFKNMINLMLTSFYDYQNESKLIFIVAFICMVVLLVLYYFIIWKTFEEKLNILLKESSDLINLIPQEIRNIIIEKFNEWNGIELR